MSFFATPQEKAELNLSFTLKGKGPNVFATAEVFLFWKKDDGERGGLFSKEWIPVNMLRTDILKSWGEIFEVGLGTTYFSLKQQQGHCNCKIS